MPCGQFLPWRIEVGILDHGDRDLGQAECLEQAGHRVRIRSIGTRIRFLALVKDRNLDREEDEWDKASHVEEVRRVNGE